MSKLLVAVFVFTGCYHSERICHTDCSGWYGGRRNCVQRCHWETVKGAQVATARVSCTVPST